MTSEPIQVLLVDNSPVALAVLKRALNETEDVTVVGAATTGREALTLIEQLRPHVVCTGLHMREMDGLALTREILDRFPRPILLVSSNVEPGDISRVYPVLQAGALDVLAKPAGVSGQGYEQFRRSLVAKLRILAGVHVFRRPLGSPVASTAARSPTPATGAGPGTRAGQAPPGAAAAPPAPGGAPRPTPAARTSPLAPKAASALPARPTPPAHQAVPANHASATPTVPPVTSPGYGERDADNAPRGPSAASPQPAAARSSVLPARSPRQSPAATRANPETASTGRSPGELAFSRPIGAAAPPRLVVIGASTGGPAVLASLLGDLPARFPLPILVVQHIAEGFLSGLVDWLAHQSALQIKVADAGEIPMPGTVYFAPEGRHLQLDRRGRLMCSHAAPVDGHCPSVTVTMQSAAQQIGSACVGVLLTGMGADGAAGMAALAKAGAFTIVQNEISCAVFGMGRQAVLLGAADQVLAPDDIVRALLRLGKMAGRSDAGLTGEGE